MSQILVLVNLYSMPIDDSPGIDVQSQRCFFTEDAAKKWILQQNPNHPEGFEYTCPSEGCKDYRTYGIEYIVLEEK